MSKIFNQIGVCNIKFPKSIFKEECNGFPGEDNVSRFTIIDSYRVS
jgi:hypothetical protein